MWFRARALSLPCVPRVTNFSRYRKPVELENYFFFIFDLLIARNDTLQLQNRIFFSLSLSLSLSMYVCEGL